MPYCVCCSYLFLCLVLNLFSTDKAFSQSISTESNHYKNNLSAKYFQNLLTIKDLPVPENYQRSTYLPPLVDNSTLPYLPPVFEQTGASCNQAGGIYNNFTYEINRLRDLSATPEHQYPTHFMFCFQNDGGNTATSIAESWELMKSCGTPNVVDYGGIYAPSPLTNTQWMSGYDKYYNAMKNKVEDFYRIRINTPAGLEVLKHWLNDHLDNSAVGGVANFYAELITSEVLLPTGTPWAGSHVITQCDTLPDHCMTIVGYNDLIEYDYNNDGQYTNTLDINGDGIVDMQDWEIGGVKIVNSYGTGYGDNGFSYLMYKVLASPVNQGGIWNNSVYIVIPEKDYQPTLTFKADITQNKRNSIRLIVGISDNQEDTVPQHSFIYPIFNFQGGPFPMQGSSKSAGKSEKNNLLDNDFLEF
ncbi:MAG: hypothetical protein NTU44_10170, partial [Bacteroidetes bacterium]|nr:hypothetical protein [Bacteroidota bacterium]